MAGRWVCARRRTRPQSTEFRGCANPAGSTARGFVLYALRRWDRRSGGSSDPPDRQMTMDYSKLDGLIPAVVQDHKSGEVLMVGFMNEEAWDVTRRTGYVTF